MTCYVGAAIGHPNGGSRWVGKCGVKGVFQETSGRENLGASIQHEDGI